jgi:outer membrane protein OmpA-like peptidoglycan-associated protein
METQANRASLVLPVLLAVIGVASLATAVMLVPLIIRESMAQMAPVSPAELVPRPAAPPPAHPETVPPEQATPPTAPEPGPTAPATQAPAAAQPAAPEAAAAQAIAKPAADAPSPSATAAAAAGPWTLRLDEASYTLSESSETTLGAIVLNLKSAPKTKVLLTGINNPMRSSKRAKRAAARVREILIESGIERYRLQTKGSQQEGTEGVIVRVEITGVAK